MPDPVVPLVNAPATSPAAAVPGGASPSPSSAGPPAAGPGAPVAGTPIPAPAAQPTAASPPPTPAAAPAPAAAPVAPAVDPRDTELASLRQKYAAIEPYARIGWEQTQRPPQAAAPAPVAAAPVVPKVFDIPDFPDHLQGMLSTDANGNYVEKPGAPPGTAALYQQHVQAKARALDQFLRDPGKVLTPFLADIETRAAEKAEKNLQTKVQHASREQAEQQIFETNKAWLCHLDAQGNPMASVDPLSGQRSFQFTADGHLFLQHYRALAQSGLAPAVAAEYAVSRIAMERARAAMVQNPASPLSAPAVAPAAAPTPQQTFLSSLPGASPQAAQPPADLNRPNGPNMAQGAKQFFVDRFRAAGLGNL